MFVRLISQWPPQRIARIAWPTLAALLLALLPAAVLAERALAFDIGGQSVAPGSRASVSLDVPAGASDPATMVPVTVLHGAAPGPVLVVVAGVHGYEFAPILAGQAFVAQIDPAALRGTVLVAHVANVSAFEQRAPYVNPYDRKNLNRSFPGSLVGTQTERIARVLATELIDRADFVIDVHSGDGAEWLEAFVGVYGGPLATDFDTALAMARAFDFPNIVRYRMETQEQIDRGRSLNRQAVAAGAATVLVEIGQNGSREPAHVQAIVAGLTRVLGVLGIQEGAGPAPGEARLFDGTSSVPVGHTGVWSPARPGGREVRKGETLGVIRSYWGDVLETVIAPVSGYAIYGLAGPPVRQGDSVMTIARPVESFEPAPAPAH